MLELADRARRETKPIRRRAACVRRQIQREAGNRLRASQQAGCVVQNKANLAGSEMKGNCFSESGLQDKREEHAAGKRSQFASAGRDWRLVSGSATDQGCDAGHAIRRRRPGIAWGREPCETGVRTGLTCGPGFRAEFAIWRFTRLPGGGIVIDSETESLGGSMYGH